MRGGQVFSPVWPRVIAPLLSLVLVFSCPGVSTAQAPTVALYADPSGNECNIPDTQVGLLTIYVVVTNSPIGLTAVQFAAPVAPCFTGSFLSDGQVFPVTIGNSQTGVAIGFGTCLSTPIHVLSLNLFAQATTPACCVYPVLPDPNVPSGEIELVDCNSNPLYGQTLSSTINGDETCPCGVGPFAPWNPSPPDDAVNVPLSVTLSWDASHPQGDPLTFDVYFGNTATPPLVVTDHPQKSYGVGPLSFDTRYYWQIVARDPSDNESQGPLWDFTTMGGGQLRLVVSEFSSYCGLITTDTVAVDVDIVTVPTPIDSCAIDITYDPSILTLISCEPGLLTSGWQEFHYSDLGDRIHVGGDNPDPIEPGSSGSFAVLEFLSDCCGIQDPVQISMCPVDPVGDLEQFTLNCGEFGCDVFETDGDVNADGMVTPGDALCAFKGYLVFPDDPGGACGSWGWDVRSDVNCSGDITPADAACIFNHWLDGSCQFCSPARAIAPAASPLEPPVVSVDDVEIDGVTVSIPIHLSGVSGMRAFGFEVTYPHGLEYTGIDRTELTQPFVAVDAHVLAAGHLRAGGFSSDAVEGHEAGDIAVLRFRLEDGAVNGTIIVQQFVDHLRGAEVVTYRLGSARTPQSVATHFRLYQNFPNPFNPVTTIRYQIPENLSNVPVKLTVYDVHGKQVRRLVSGTQSGGLHHIEWDSTNDQGVPVSSGLYFYVLRAGSQTMRNKMVLLK